VANLPILLNSDAKRMAIVGETGDGKTVSGLWVLSLQAIDQYPWIIYDWKRDKHINSMERAKYVGLDFVPKPRDRGIYIVQPRRGDFEAVEAQLDALWERENVGIYIDEGRMIENSEVAEDLMTQGRSKNIPMIVLSQRPVDVSRYLWGQCEFHQVFPTRDMRDLKTMRNYIPGIDEKPAIPKYHSYYFDKDSRELIHLKPVPLPKDSLAVIDDKLAVKRVRV
jgi:hypothetical protein